MPQPYRRLANLTSSELSERAAEYRRMAMTARGQATISSLNLLAVRYAILAARRELEESNRLERSG